jgi:hypothetical protein
MRPLAQFCSGLALLTTVGVPLLFLFHPRLTLGDVQWCLLLAMVLWFVATPLWLERADRHPKPPDPPAQ